MLLIILIKELALNPYCSRVGQNKKKSAPFQLIRYDLNWPHLQEVELELEFELQEAGIY